MAGSTSISFDKALVHISVSYRILFWSLPFHSLHTHTPLKIQLYHIALKVFRSVPHDAQLAQIFELRRELRGIYGRVVITKDVRATFTTTSMAVVNVVGYSFELVDPDTKGGLLCAECELILKEAVQTEEGVRLCHGCYEKIAKLPGCKSSKSGVCVLDENLEKPTCYPDKAVRREVNQLRIYCENKPLGCEWMGQLAKYLETHKSDCKYVPVECPNKSKGCMERVSEAQLQAHLENDCQYRTVTCQHCAIETIFKDLEHHHGECEDYPEKCELCDQLVKRKQMLHHKKEECSKFRCVCDSVVERKGEKGHAAARHFGLSESPAVLLTHFISIVTLTKTLIDEMKDMQKRVSQLEMYSKMPQVLPKDLVTSGDLAAALEEVRGSVKPLQKLQTDWSSEQTNLNASIKLFKNNLEDMDRKSKQQDALISSLKTRLEQQTLAASWDSPGRMTSNRSGLEGGRGAMTDKKYEELERQVTSLKVHVSELELQLQASLASTYNGALLWRIPDIPRRRRDAIDERITSIYSPPFYTGRNGYKMCIRAYLNGDGMGYKTHLSLFFVVMKGEFDALLKWPFEYKVSLILVDQTHRKHIVQTFKPTPDSNSFQRPVSDMNTASGCPTFAKLTALEDHNYVKDDVIFIKCIVDTSKIFHP